MSKPAPPDPRVREEASQWLARIERGLRAEEGSRLCEWLRHSAHREAIVEIARLWHGPDAIAVLSALFPVSLEGVRPKVRRNLPLAALAAAAALLIPAAAVMVMSGPAPWPSFTNARAPRPVPINYATALGERREVTLADNSTVTLNTGTRMAVVYSKSSRDVYVPYGEASFRVAHEPGRPFNVRAGKRQFQSVGTEFNVRVLTPEDVEITVTEGNVKVLYEPSRVEDTPALARLRDNVMDDDTTVGALETALVEPGFQFLRKIQVSDAEARLAWQRGLIVLRSSTLAEAVAEVGRYTPLRFVLADEKLRDVRISGYFHTGDVDALLRLLRERLFIDWKLDEEGRIVLTAMNHGCTPVRGRIRCHTPLRSIIRRS